MSSVYENITLDRIATAIENGQAGGGSLTVDVTGAGDMQGCDAGTAGVHGLVPAPAAGDQDKVLYGDGTWKAIGESGGLPDYSNVIASGTYNNSSGWNYTATDDCWVFVMIGIVSNLVYPTITINSTSIGWYWFAGSSGCEMPMIIPLKAGDVLDISAQAGGIWSETYYVYGV